MDNLELNTVDREIEVQKLNELLDTYIQQDLDQKNMIGELQLKIYELQNQIEDSKKDLIKKDLLHIISEGYEIDNDEEVGVSSETLDDIVDYILERENK